jgi:hypothetical protein
MARTICQKLIRHIPDWTVLHRPVGLAGVSGNWLWPRLPHSENPVSQDLPEIVHDSIPNSREVGFSECGNLSKPASGNPFIRMLSTKRVLQVKSRRLVQPIGILRRH